jgi:hypothetical protein
MNKIAIALIIVVLLVVYGLLGMDYMRQGSEQERLLSEIEEVNQSREALPEASTDFSELLAVVQANLAAEYETIPTEVSSSDVIDTILSLAQEIDVHAIPLITQPWMEQVIGENTYNVFRVNVEIEGLFSQVREYVERLESGTFTTLVVERLRIDIAEEEAYAGGATPVVASLDLAVFTQP